MFKELFEAEKMKTKSKIEIDLGAASKYDDAEELYDLLDGNNIDFTSSLSKKGSKVTVMFDTRKDYDRAKKLLG